MYFLNWNPPRISLTGATISFTVSSISSGAGSLLLSNLLSNSVKRTTCLSTPPTATRTSDNFSFSILNVTAAVIMEISLAARENFRKSYFLAKLSDEIKMLSIRQSIKGEDSMRIYRDAKMFGTDISSALAKVANRTPSLAWSELLWGLISTITTGGDLYNYLEDKAKDSMQQYRRMLESYSTQINFYTESYITMIIVGTLFFIVLSSVMSPLVGGDILLVQTFLVFFFIPLVSMGFIVLLKGISPSE